jgi:hypothetical protein
MVNREQLTTKDLPPTAMAYLPAQENFCLLSFAGEPSKDKAPKPAEAQVDRKEKIDLGAPKATSDAEIQIALKELKKRLPDDMPAKEREFVSDMAQCLLRGDEKSLQQLHSMCRDFARNPEQLKQRFEQFAKLWKSLDLGDLRVTPVLGRDETLAAVTMDIPIGQNNHLRLASRDGLGGFVVHTRYGVDDEGKLVALEQIAKESSPFGAARRIARNLVDAVQAQRKDK